VTGLRKTYERRAILKYYGLTKKVGLRNYSPQAAHKEAYVLFASLEGVAGNALSGEKYEGIWRNLSKN